MIPLPVITGFGGFGAAGRSSNHHAYRRMVIESLPERERNETLVGLAVLMKLVSFSDGVYVDQDSKHYSQAEVIAVFSEQVLAGTLVRRIESKHFDSISSLNTTHNTRYSHTKISETFQK